MYQTFVPNPESSFPIGVDTFCLRTNANAINQRRAKRHIPDNQKDELYWERRKRNNIAAKKSRENKRKLDEMKLDKFAVLEEENALLRKEICVLRARYRIPNELSIHTDEEREKCLMINRVSMQDKSKAVDDVKNKEEIVDNSPERCRVDSKNGYTIFERSRNGKAELDAGQGVSVYTPFGGVMSAIPSHEHSLQQYPSPPPGYFDAMPNAISSSRQLPVSYQYRPVKPESPCGTESSNSDWTYQEPFDLSINGSKKYEPNGRSVSQSSELNKHYISPDLLSDQNRQLKNENDEIRKKLKQLSEQVSRIQQLIYTKQEYSK
ncbi:hypothetical protein CHS0354_011843 [Potamilus streckersoni]|nr:hypothetical protein CHS0354_011843 [Potamilus streckersoni]